ncbi:MAG: shikimate dehydrogenase [Schleiferiaceae bacterium]|jgi:shikimate dehydrogenase|nr:shikimate dehydrogenase [Schleiferiaceae bacterium]
MNKHKKYGLIGKSLSHSFSQSYFTEHIQPDHPNYSYTLWELNTIREVQKLISDPGLYGFNITIPYKKEILTFADELSHEVRIIGASNTFEKTLNGWKAHNTDAFGFEQSLNPLLRKNEAALIFGDGGASKAVQYVLKQKGIPFQIVNRTSKSGDIQYDQITDELIAKSTLLINTTPVGTSPNVTDLLPLPYSSFHKNLIVFDLVYNPAETALLKKAKDAGCVTKNGLEMLHLQAQKAWEIWNRPL